MEELDFDEPQFNLPLKSWLKIIVISGILLAFILAMFGLMKWHY